MHVGIFVEERRRGVSERTAYREALDLADAAEAWGLDCVWLGEIHFNGSRSVQSAPLLLASFMAARTKRLHVGTAVQVVPLNNPLRIAEEVATIDQLSEGRFEFGIGRSGSARSYDIFGVPYAESQARFLEALHVIREAWKGRAFSYDGRFFKVDNVTVSPMPYQSPHPPMRMAANSEETFLQVGRLGLPIFVGLRDLDVATLRKFLDGYRRAWREAGHAGEGSAYLRIPVYAADTEREAIDEPREAITAFFQRHLDLVNAGFGRADTGSVERRKEVAAEVRALTYDGILKTRVVFGTGEQVIARLIELRDALGLDGFVAELNPGGALSTEQMHRTLRILTHQVMPALN